jgi:hypothetical protein
MNTLKTIFGNAKRQIETFLLSDQAFIEKDKIVILGFFALAASAQPAAAHTFDYDYNYDDPDLKVIDSEDRILGVDKSVLCTDDGAQHLNFNEVNIDEMHRLLGGGIYGDTEILTNDEFAMQDIGCSSHLSSSTCHESDHFSCDKDFSEGLLTTEFQHSNELSIASPSSEEIQATHTHSIGIADGIEPFSIHFSAHCSSYCNSGDYDTDHVNS